MVVSEDDVIESLTILTSVGNVQTQAEYEAVPEENTTADLLYPEFLELLDQAEEELQNDLTRLNLSALADISIKRCLCYLVADYIQVGQPEWDAAKLQFNQNTAVYRFANRKGSSYYYNYLRTLTNALKADEDYKERRSGVTIT